MSIPMSSPDLTAAETAAVCEVLSTPYLSIGPKLTAFEQAIASFAGCAYGVGVNSGTSGLHLAVIAADVADGDQVITTPFSFIASSNAIVYERGIPIYVDVDRRTGNIDPTLVAEAANDLARGGQAARRWLPPTLRDAPLTGKLRAILPVDAYGQPADMDAIIPVAREHDLTLICDTCESLGSHYKGQPVGGLGDVGVFAFYPNKQITTGEGAVIVTNRDDWAALFRSLRNQGRDVFDAWLNHTRLGYNYRLDEMSAALGLAQMQRVQELIAKRAQVAAWYNERLADVELIQTPTILPETTRMSWFVYVVRILPPANRDAVLNRLAARGIGTRPYFTPIHLQPFYRERFGYHEGCYPITEWLGQVSLALPFSSVMTEDQVDIACEELVSALMAK